MLELVRRSLVLVVLAATCALAACKPGGTYGETTRRSGGDIDRGETNGRMFDLISNKPDGDDWQVRLRDSSLWVAYASGTEETQLPTVNLDAKETAKLWKLIDEIDIGGRDKGERDDDEGYVQLRLREPGGDEGHDLTTIYVSRATDDNAILDLAAYLEKLISKYHKKQVDF